MRRHGSGELVAPIGPFADDREIIEPSARGEEGEDRDDGCGIEDAAELAHAEAAERLDHREGRGGEENPEGGAEGNPGGGTRGFRGQARGGIPGRGEGGEQDDGRPGKDEEVRPACSQYRTRNHEQETGDHDRQPAGLDGRGNAVGLRRQDAIGREAEEGKQEGGGETGEREQGRHGIESDCRSRSRHFHHAGNCPSPDSVAAI